VLPVVARSHLCFVSHDFWFMVRRFTIISHQLSQFYVLGTSLADGSGDFFFLFFLLAAGPGHDCLHAMASSFTAILTHYTRAINLCLALFLVWVPSFKNSVRSNAATIFFLQIPPNRETACLKRLF
jgi:hypothetical protein